MGDFRRLHSCYVNVPKYIQLSEDEIKKIMQQKLMDELDKNLKFEICEDGIWYNQYTIYLETHKNNIRGGEDDNTGKIK